MLQCLHPVANDVEENPGPTIFHIIDPTSADSSFFQLSATGYLAFLTFRLFWGASTPIICCIHLTIIHRRRMNIGEYSTRRSRGVYSPIFMNLRRIIVLV